MCRKTYHHSIQKIMKQLVAQKLSLSEDAFILKNDFLCRISVSKRKSRAIDPISVTRSIALDLRHLYLCYLTLDKEHSSIPLAVRLFIVSYLDHICYDMRLIFFISKRYMFPSSYVSTFM